MNKNVGTKHDIGKAVYTGDVGRENRERLFSIKNEKRFAIEYLISIFRDLASIERLKSYITDEKIEKLKLIPEYNIENYVNDYKDAIHNFQTELSNKFTDLAMKFVIHKSDSYRIDGKLIVTLNKTLDNIYNVFLCLHGGALTHGLGNFMHVEPIRFVNALCRHVEEWVLADDVNCLDKDSGLPVYAHIIANCIFLSKLLRGKNE